MKHLLFTALIFISSQSLFAQKTDPVPPDLPINKEDGKVNYTEVVEISGIDKTELYKRANNWLHDFYKNPGSVIKEMDSTEGKILLTPQFNTYRTLKDGTKAQSALILYDLQIDLKDGKYRFNIHDIQKREQSYFPIEKLLKADDPNVEDNFNTLSEADKYFKDVVTNLKKAMQIPSNKEKKDEW